MSNIHEVTYHIVENYGFYLPASLFTDFATFGLETCIEEEVTTIGDASRTIYEKRVKKEQEALRQLELIFDLMSSEDLESSLDDLETPKVKQKTKEEIFISGEEE